MPNKRGDVALVLYPDSNLRTAKRRPVLVVQADNLGTARASSRPCCAFMAALQDAGHGFKGEDAERAEKAMFEFFDRQLKK
jgi:hypothetical protein